MSLKVPAIPRIAVIGFGAMAKSLLRSLNESQAFQIKAALVPPGLDVPGAPADMVIFHSVHDLIAWEPDLVVECAGHEAIRSAVIPLLQAGFDTVLISVGSLASDDIRQSLETSAREGGGRLVLPSGAVGGLDVLGAAALAGLDVVSYTGTKPVGAWNGTPAAEQFELQALKVPTIIFEGSARDAARLYPKNANVTAAIALAGVGFDKTIVRLVADPLAAGNTHRLSAEGSFGRFEIELQNEPLPDNPKTSWLAALSVEQAIVSHFAPIKL